MDPVFFSDQNEFRAWLEKNHDKKTEIIVGYHKVATGKPGLSWSESVDQALCFGWIDGIRRSLGEESYCIRFTPRKPASNWSNLNIRKVEELKRKGLMMKSGFDLYNNRKKEKSGNYSFEKESATLDENFEKSFRKKKNAYDFFCKQPPSYRKTRINWIMSAKQAATRLARLNKLIMACENQQRLF